MAQVGVTAKYTFLDYLRSRTIVIAHYRPKGILDSPLDFYASWWGGTATFVVVLSGVFFGGDAISGEFQNKTGYFTIPNPIRRSSVYVGKWISAFIASSVVLFIFAAITMANGFYYHGLSV